MTSEAEEAEYTEAFLQALSNRLTSEALADFTEHFTTHVRDDGYTRAWRCAALRMLDMCDNMHQHQFRVIEALTGGTPVVPPD